MSITKTQIISNALLLLGHSPISSLSGGDSLVVAAESAYDYKLPSVLATGNWRFATQRQQLSLLAEEPPPPWKYQYLLPAGYLKTIMIYPHFYNWEIYANERLYTMTNGELWMEYVFQPTVSHLPYYFVDYFIYEIASFLALSSAEKVEYYSALEQKRIRMQAMASAIDAQNRPNFSQTVFPVLDNRYIGGLMANSFSS